MDIYAAVTDRIIAELEKGNIPWNKPWSGGAAKAIRRSNGRSYSLINQMLLGKPGEYLTYNQCQKEGGKIKKGAKSKMVVFWKWLQKDKTDSDGNLVRDDNGLPVIERIPMLRYFNVFHIDDCEGLEPKYVQDKAPATAEPVERAEEVIKDYAGRAKLRIDHSEQDEAYYSPSRHLVSLPLMEQFETTAGYYETAFHELVHSTGHKSLLNRFNVESGVAAFGSDSYSKEELVAEIGACGIMYEMALETEQSFRNNAAYIQNWLGALKNDKRLIVSAAGRAEKAMKLILNSEDEPEEE